MKRLIVVIFTISIVLCSCGSDDPAPDITLSDLDKRLDDIEDEIDTLRQDVAQGNIKVVEGAKPIDFRDETEIIQDQTGGVPPTGEPTGEPVADPIQGVPAFGEGRIVFKMSEEIYIMGSNGAGKTEILLADFHIRSPALSPDGERIAYTASNDPGGGDRHLLYIRHIETGNEFRLISEDNAYHPAWSADGEQIAYDDGGDLYISSVDMANPQVFKITHGGSHHTNPTWSPDGRQIAFASNLDGNWNIFAINVDGTNRVRLTNDPADDERPDWSPDGRHIAFMTHRHGTWDIYIVNTRTFVETQLTESDGNYQKPSWSPDGEKIAFSEEAEGEIYVIDADGTDLTNITNSPDHHEGSADWQ